MEKSPKQQLEKLWKTASSAYAGFAESASSNDTDRNVASTLSWILPTSQVCAVYSIPMGALEMFALRVGNWIVGSPGAFPASEFADQVRRQGFVPAPCRVKDFHAPLHPQAILTECLSGSKEFQEFDLVA
jgi:hypothetical protein